MGKRGGLAEGEAYKTEDILTADYRILLCEVVRYVARVTQSFWVWGFVDFF